jgi:hypothetical protein
MKIFRYWKIIYAVCSLVYIGWVINVGSNEFARINDQYSRIVDQLDTGRIRNGALEELSAECRRESRKRPDLEKKACTSWPPAVVEAKGKEIEKRLTRARERGIVKVVLFYAAFVLFFLLGPPLFMYLLLLGFIKLYRSIKIVR